MIGLRNPAWLKKYIYTYNGVDDISNTVFETINSKLDKLCSDKPEVSITIAVWNEEIKLLSTISSLADSLIDTSVEIIVINNNSTDRTQEVLNKLHVKSFLQPIQGFGPARQAGLEHASGKYILTADADCIYPPKWIKGMLTHLKKPGVVCVYGRYSFIGNQNTPRWKLYLYEKMKNVIAEIRHQRHPFLNTLGMTMGFIREHAIKVGYIMENVRGEDGMLTLYLMQFGDVVPVKDNQYRIWTGTRTIDKDESLSAAVMLRVISGFKKMSTYFKHPLAYNEKTAEEYLRQLKNNPRNI